MVCAKKCAKVAMGVGRLFVFFFPGGAIVDFPGVAKNVFFRRGQKW